MKYLSYQTDYNNKDSGILIQITIYTKGQNRNY